MASNLSETLKKADLQRFATRAAQLERARPIVTYWLEYYILQQILGQKLHTTDNAASDYAVQLMDKLEATKADNAANDAIVDDVAAKAYIENFALETFNRADESQRTNKVTKQTADTFMAAVTFMDALSIFGEVEAEVREKSRFAKFHARRILVAVKEGRDPNESNPVVEEVPQDSIDLELSDIAAQQNGISGNAYQPPSVESSGQDSTNNALEGQTALPSMPQQQNDYQVSPIDIPAEPNSRTGSIGGGYFPSATSAPTDPTGPTDIDMQDPSSSDPIPPPPENMNPKDFYNTAAPPPPQEPSAPLPEALGITSPARPGRPTPDQMTAQPPAIPPMQSPPPAQSPPPTQMPPRQVPHSHLASKPAPPGLFPQPQQSQAPPPQQTQQAAPTTGFKTDDEATMAAQKHARWAISALNFEDVNTAVKELREALRSLGAG